MDKITNTKNEFRLKQWTKIIEACQDSGMPIVTWCNQNSVRGTGVTTHFCVDTPVPLTPLHEEIVSKELHHANGNRGVPGFDEPINLREVWPWEHENLLPLGRRLDYDFIKFK